MSRWLVKNLPATVLISLLHHQELVVALDDNRGGHMKIALHQLRTRAVGDTLATYLRRFLVGVAVAEEKLGGISTKRYSPGIREASLNAPI